MHFSNTFWQITKRDNFKAIYIERDVSRFNDLMETAKKYKGKIIPICAFVQIDQENSLANILKSFDLLSIDVDGIDYQIWEKFESYSPKILIIEINSSISPYKELIHGYENAQGSSFLSMLKLGERKGYKCICHTGNMIFLRNDLIKKAGFEGMEEFFYRPELLFDKSWL